MIRRYMFILSALFCVLSVGAQNKKRKANPPVIETLPPPISNSQSQNSTNSPKEHFVTTTVGPVASVVTRDGKIIYFSNFTELEKTNYSEFKELKFSAINRNQPLNETVLIKVFAEAKSLEVLQIDSYKIDRFPEIKKRNEKLKKLVLNRNSLKSLPDNFSNLVGLEVFVSQNPLHSIPESFSQLTELTQLNLDDIEFTEFPKVIFSLSKLTALSVSGSYKISASITELPNLFMALSNLETLAISSTELSTLPNSISALKKLKTVNFSHNKFTTLPEILANHTNLVYVTLSNNPLEFNAFLKSIKKIKWRGLFFLNETGFTKEQYEQIRKNLPKIDVYYDGMND